MGFLAFAHTLRAEARRQAEGRSFAFQPSRRLSGVTLDPGEPEVKKIVRAVVLLRDKALKVLGINRWRGFVGVF
jgi:hypothetical protein